MGLQRNTFIFQWEQSFMYLQCGCQGVGTGPALKEVSRTVAEYFLKGQEVWGPAGNGCVLGHVLPIPAGPSTSQLHPPPPQSFPVPFLPDFSIPRARGRPGSWQLTGFGGSLRSKVSGKLLEDLCTVFLHEEADEVGGGIELQGQRG